MTPEAVTQWRGGELPRRIFGAAVLLFLSALLVAHGIARCIIRAAPPQMFESELFGITRLTQILGALDEIAAKDDSAVLLGPSTTMQGITPQMFDAEMHQHSIDVSTYNLGALALTPDHVLMLSRRLADAYRHSGRRARAVLIELCPHTLTEPQTQMAQDWERIHVFKRARMTTMSDFFHPNVIEPGTLGALRANARWRMEIVQAKILGGIDQLALVNIASAVLTALTGTRDKPRPDDPFNKRIWDAAAAANGGQYPHWDHSTRGDFQRLRPSTTSDYDQLVTIKSSDAALQRAHKAHVQCCDIDELRITERQVGYLTSAIRTAQTFSDHVFVYIVPRNPKANRPTEPAIERVRELSARIERELGTPVIDLSMDPSFVPDDFFDLTHMNELTGRRKLSQKLADEVAKRWPAKAAPR